MHIYVLNSFKLYTPSFYDLCIIFIFWSCFYILWNISDQRKILDPSYRRSVIKFIIIIIILFDINITFSTYLNQVVVFTFRVWIKNDFCKTTFFCMLILIKWRHGRSLIMRYRQTVTFFKIKNKMNYVQCNVFLSEVTNCWYVFHNVAKKWIL